MWMKETCMCKPNMISVFFFLTFIIYCLMWMWKQVAKCKVKIARIETSPTYIKTSFLTLIIHCVYSYMYYCVFMLFYMMMLYILCFGYAYSCEYPLTLYRILIFVLHTIATSKIKSWRTYCLQVFRLWRWIYGKYA